MLTIFVNTYLFPVVNNKEALKMKVRVLVQGQKKKMRELLKMKIKFYFPTDLRGEFL